MRATICVLSTAIGGGLSPSWDIGGVQLGDRLDLPAVRHRRCCPQRFRRVRPRFRRIGSRPLRSQPLPEDLNERVQARDETERSLQNAPPVREGAREFSIHSKQLVAGPPRFSWRSRAHGDGCVERLGSIVGDVEDSAEIFQADGRLSFQSSNRLHSASISRSQ